MTTPREHAELTALYFADTTLKCWARLKSTSESWWISNHPAFDDPSLEYYVGHEPPPPPKRTVTFVVNDTKWVLPAPLRGDGARDFWYFSERGSIKRGFKISTYYDEIRTSIEQNGGSVYASKEDAQAWADFFKWCRGGGV